MAEEHLDVVIRAQDELTPGLKQIESGIIRFVGAISAGLAAIKLVAFPIVEAAAFQKEMLNVQRTTGLTDASIKLLSADLLELSTHINVSALDLAKIAFAAGQLGLGHKGQELTNFVATVARFSADLGVDAELAANAFGKLTNLFNIPIAQAENLSAALVNVKHNSTATASELLQTVQRLGSAGGILSAPQSLALAATGIDLGGTPETIATFFTKELSQMQVKANDFAKLMKSDLIKNTKDWVEFFRKDAFAALLAVNDKISHLQDPDQGAVVKNLIGGGRLTGLENKLINEGGPILQAHLGQGQVGFAEGTAALREQAITLSGLSAQSDLLKNSLNKLGTEIGQSVTPAFTQFVINLKDTVNSPKFRDFFFQLADQISTAASAIIKLATVLGGPFSVNITNLLKILELFVGVKLGEVILGWLGSFSVFNQSIKSAAGLATTIESAFNKVTSPILTLKAAAVAANDFRKELFGVTEQERLRQVAAEQTASAIQAATKSEVANQALVAQQFKASEEARVLAAKAASEKITLARIQEHKAVVQQSIGGQAAELALFESAAVASAGPLAAGGLHDTAAANAVASRVVAQKLSDDLVIIEQNRNKTLAAVHGTSTTENIAYQRAITLHYMEEVEKRKLIAIQELEAIKTANSGTLAAFLETENSKVIAALDADKKRLANTEVILAEIVAAEKKKTEEIIALNEQSALAIRASQAKTLELQEAALGAGIVAQQTRAASNASTAEVGGVATKAANIIAGTFAFLGIAASKLIGLLRVALGAGLWIGIAVTLADMFGITNKLTEAFFKFGDALGFVNSKRDEANRLAREAVDAEVKEQLRLEAATAEARKARLGGGINTAGIRQTFGPANGEIDPHSANKQFQDLIDKVVEFKLAIDDGNRKLAETPKVIAQSTEAIEKAQKAEIANLDRIKELQKEKANLEFINQHPEASGSITPGLQDFSLIEKEIKQREEEQKKLEKATLDARKARDFNNKDRSEAINAEIKANLSQLEIGKQQLRDLLKEDVAAGVPLTLELNQLQEKQNKLVQERGSGPEATIRTQSGSEAQITEAQKQSAALTVQIHELDSQIAAKTIAFEDLLSSLDANGKQSLLLVRNANASQLAVIAPILEQIKVLAAQRKELAFTGDLIKGVFKGAGTEDLSLAKGLIDAKNSLEKARDNAEFEQAKFHGSRLEALNQENLKQGLTDEVSFAALRIGIQQDTLVRELAIKEKERDAFAKTLLPTSNATELEKIRAEQQIATLDGTLSILREKIAGGALDLHNAVTDAISQAEAEFLGLQARLFDEQGQFTDAAINNLFTQFNLLQKKFKSVVDSTSSNIGQDQKDKAQQSIDIIIRLEGIAAAKAQLQELNAQIDNINKIQGLADEKSKVDALLSSKTTLEIEQERVQASLDQAAALDELIPKLEEAAFAEKEGTQRRLAALIVIDQTKIKIRELAGAISDTAKAINEGLSTAIQDGLFNIVTGAKSVKDALKDTVKSIADQINKVAIKQVVEEALGSFNKGPGSFGDIISKALGVAPKVKGLDPNDPTYVNVVNLNKPQELPAIPQPEGLFKRPDIENAKAAEAAGVQVFPLRDGTAPQPTAVGSFPAKGGANRETVVSVAKAAGVDPALALAIWAQESSSGKNTKTSVTGNVGQFQVGEAAFSDTVKKHPDAFGPTPDIRNDLDNIKAGILYFHDLGQRFATQDQALAAYFAGPGNVNAAIKRGLPGGIPTAPDPNGKTPVDYIKDINARVVDLKTQAIDPTIKASEQAIQSTNDLSIATDKATKSLNDLSVKPIPSNSDNKDFQVAARNVSLDQSKPTDTKPPAAGTNQDIGGSIFSTLFRGLAPLLGAAVGNKIGGTEGSVVGASVGLLVKQFEPEIKKAITGFFSHASDFFKDGVSGLDGLFSDSGVFGGLFDTIKGFFGNIVDSIKGLFESAQSSSSDTGGGGFWSSIIGLFTSSFRTGGYVKPQLYAGGGKIVGPGTGTSDSIPAIIDGRFPARLSTGEHIMPADKTAVWGPLLEAIRKGIIGVSDISINPLTSLPNPILQSTANFAAGGIVGRAGEMGLPTGNNTNVSVTVNTTTGESSTNTTGSTDRKSAEDLGRNLSGVVVAEIIKQQRPGGLLAR